MKDEKRTEEGREKLTGIKQISDFIGRSDPTLLDWHRLYEFPMKRNPEGVWELYLDDFLKWAAGWNFRKDSKSPASDLEEERLKRYFASAGEGKIITGDIGKIAKTLDMDWPRLVDWMKMDDCPIEQISGTNQYRVGRIAFEAFCFRHKIGPWSPKNSKRIIKWS